MWQSVCNEVFLFLFMGKGNFFTVIINDKRVLSFCGKTGSADSLSSVLVPIYQSKQIEFLKRKFSHMKW